MFEPRSWDLNILNALNIFRHLNVPCIIFRVPHYNTIVSVSVHKRRHVMRWPDWWSGSVLSHTGGSRPSGSPARLAMQTRRYVWSSNADSERIISSQHTTTRLELPRTVELIKILCLCIIVVICKIIMTRECYWREGAAVLIQWNNIDL